MNKNHRKKIVEVPCIGKINRNKRTFSRSAQRATLVELLQAIDTPYSLEIAKKLRDMEPFTIDRPNPNEFETASEYFAAIQSYAIVSKSKFLVDPALKGRFTLEDKAIDTFYEGELACLKTNIRFRQMNFSFMERSVLELARAFCSQILGPVRCSTPDFGPGSTIFKRGLDTNIISKLSALPETTPYAYEHVVKTILDKMPHYAIACGMVVRDRTALSLGSQLATMVHSAQFFTVDKNWKARRGCAIEPSGQMLCQKGYGETIKTDLRQFGFDLIKAPDLHGRMAREGSLTGKYATIDLASASDTIATEFVRFMLPPEWFEALNTVRSRSITIGCHTKRLEKFSSMGNGFTFELESLLFLCLMLAVRKYIGFENTRLSVFGDDMICHPKVAESLIPILECCGFTVNVEKTFITGSFRESCGHDYFKGTKVTPVYFKEKEDGAIESLYYYLNRITALASAYNFGIGLSGRFYDVWFNILQRVPCLYRYGGPTDFGDIVIHNHEWKTNRKGRLAVLERKSRYYRRFSTPDLALACAIYGVPSRGVIPRGAKYTLDTRWLVTYPRIGDRDIWITET